MPYPQLDTADDFKALFPDVRPLTPDGRVSFQPPKPSPHPHRRHQHGRPPPAGQAFTHAVGWFEPAHSPQHFLRNGMQSGTLRRLAALHWPVVAELDLHGFDRHNARDRLALFLHKAGQHGNCVRIIHGRGIGSTGTPVLKQLTRTWLCHHPDVLAWCDVSHGGALLVLLRRARY